MIKDTEFRVRKFKFQGFVTNQWIVEVKRTFDDGEGYKGENWRNIGTHTFDSEELGKEFIKNQNLKSWTLKN